MKNNKYLLGIFLAVMMLGLVSSAYPQFQAYSTNSGTLRSSGTATFGVNVTNTNGTAYLHFDGLNYTGTNTTAINTGNTTIFNVSIALDNELGETFVYYWYSYSNNATASYNASQSANYVLLPKFEESGQAIYTTMKGAGAGLGVFIQYMGQALPYLMIVLIMIGIICAIGYAVSHVIKSSIKDVKAR